MAFKTPAQIDDFVKTNQYRMDAPYQYFGDEPNSYRKPWDESTLRFCLFACWAYEQAAGNQAIPLVYRTINEHNSEYLADRSYFHSTPRDLKMFEKAGIPVFGVESKHQLRDFDVIGTSISYPVLSINFTKQLMMSDIPPLWETRHENPEQWPFVIVGGQLYGAPEVAANIADAIFCGEVEDEDGNPGLGAVFDRIAAMKRSGRWDGDRRSCYADLALEFNFLYFPCFVDVHYGYEDRPSVARVNAGLGIEETFPSKQVVGYTSNLAGMRMPFRKRIVKDMDSVEGLVNPPLLYIDPGMGAGDAEVGRGCPAWCSFPLALNEPIVTRQGIKPIGDLIGTVQEVWTPTGWAKAEVENHGEHVTQKVTFVPAAITKTGRAQRRGRTKFRHEVVTTPCHGWPLLDGTETHDLKVGDVVKASAAREVLDDESHALGWVHGFLFGDGHQRHTSSGERQPKESGSFKVRLFGTKDGQHKGRFARFLAGNSKSGWGEKDFRVTAVEAPEWAGGDVVVHGWSPFDVKSFPQDADADYNAGFLAGWMAADAWPRHSDRGDLEDTWVLDAQHRPAHHGGTSPEEWLKLNAASAGWVLVGTSQQGAPTNYGKRSAPLVRHTLKRSEQVAWVVESIEEQGVAHVACLTVPGAHRFALASGIGSLNCALTYRQKPYRQRSVDYMVNMTQELVKNTGGIHIAPFSPDFPMHTQKKKLISAILENVTDDVDASSMRVDDFIADPSYILLQAHGGMDTVTLGVEGNSQRMRDLVGKGAADEDIKEAVARGIAAGLIKFKLYMIASLPGEDEGDIYRILSLAKDLADIRDSMGSKARIQFSWTPMLIEGNTPFQWFSPTTSNYALGDVWEEFRDLKIDFKLGGKAQKDKLGYFQLTQRASREVGKAMVEAVIEMGQGCWGGAPRGLYELVDESLRAHGFLNGYADCYDERRKHDMFGWEMIDQGINVELMWVTYQQMLEMLENTDSDTYDLNFGDEYHGNEWIERCDTKCYGKTCGVCDADDLKIRRNYIQAAAEEVNVNLNNVKVIDQKSVAMKFRAKVVKGEDKRFVMNDHFRYAIRRAAYRAELPITKRTVKFATDNIKFKDWTCGVDYVEFGLTRRLNPKALGELVEKMNVELQGHAEQASIQFAEWTILPADADPLRSDVDLSLFEMEVDVEPSTAQRAIEKWFETDYIKMVFREESRQSGVITEEVNARDYVDDLWLARDGHRLMLKMLIRGKATPYLVYAALFEKNSWLEAAKYPAFRIEAFVENDANEVDFFRGTCQECGASIPTNVLDKSFDSDYCPKHKDEADGLLYGALVSA